MPVLANSTITVPQRRLAAPVPFTTKPSLKLRADGDPTLRGLSGLGAGPYARYASFCRVGELEPVL
jgi:hypothetical protein